MNKIFIFCLLATVVFSCKNKNDVEPGNPCVGAVETPSFHLTCSDDRSGEPFCEVEFIGDFRLEESSKAYQAQYCEPVGKIVRYKNVNGEVIELKIEEKSYQKSNAIYGVVPGCMGDSSKPVGYCIDFERLEIKMKSDSAGLDLTLSVQTRPDLQNPGQRRVGDILVVTRRLGNNAFAVVSFVVNKRTLGYEEEFNQEHLDQIVLLGKSYSDLITNDITLFTDPKPYKYYFNKEVGMIGFVDQTGVLWVIEG